jgi:phosphoribosylformylglycinamidine (FGAM) synthase PurS component
MALQQLDPTGKALRRSLKRRRKNERRERRNQKAMRFKLYVGSLAALLVAVAAIARVVLS